MAEPVADKKPHPIYPDRSADGQVRDGNQIARKSGIYSAAVKRGEVPPDLRQSVDEFRAGLIADAGGLSALTTIGMAHIARFCEIDVMLRMLMNDLVTRGMFTAKGRVRSTFDKTIIVLGMWQRYAQRYDVVRLAKHVPSMEEFLNHGAAFYTDG